MKVVEINVYLVKAGMLHPVICKIVTVEGIGASDAIATLPHPM